VIRFPAPLVTESEASAWQATRFSEFLASNKRPYTLGPAEDANLVGMRLYGAGPFHRELKPAGKILKKTHFVIKTGDVIYNKLFAWKGTFGLVPAELDGMFVSDKFPTYELDTTKVDPAFLAWCFRYPPLWDQARRMSTGSAALSKLTLNPPRFMELTVRLPPLTRQKEIAAALDSLAASLEEATRVQRAGTKEATVLQARTMADAFPEGTTEKLGGFARVQSGYAFKSEWFTEDGIRLARNVNVSHGVLDWSQEARLPVARQAEFARFELNESDILVSLDRPIISSGVKVARVRKEDLPCLLLQRVGRFQLHDGRVDPDYLFRWLQSPRFVLSIDPGRSNGVPHISQKQIEAIPFAAPPLEEQRRVVAYLDGIDRRFQDLSRLRARAAMELEALVPSVLASALGG
jgi:Type I restriction modification DNA specificity domain